MIVKFEDGKTDEEITASLMAIGGTRVGKPLGFDNLFLVETTISRSSILLWGHTPPQPGFLT